MTFSEYVERELASNVRSEYHAGEVFELSGGTIDHSRIIRNLSRRLAERLEGKPCEAFEANLRVYVQAFDRGYYPDAQVICGSVEHLPNDLTRTTVVNPTVVFEVLSPGTSEYDNSEKLRAYISIPTLKQYVMIESTLAYVALLTRRDVGWLRTDASGQDSVLRLESLEMDLKLSELYYGVNFRERA
jgi:Uma2 family endonuclease